MRFHKNKFGQSGHVQIAPIFFVFVILCLAVAAAVSMAQGDYFVLIMSACLAFVGAYYSSLWRHTWLIAVFLCLFSFDVAPFGFLIPSSLLATGFAISCMSAVVVRKALGLPSPNSLYNINPNPNFFVIFGWVWALYLIVHALFSFTSPVYPHEFGIANSVKAYAEDFAPVFVLLMLFFLRYRMPDWKGFYKKWTWLILVSLILLIAYRVYLIFSGFMEEDDAFQFGAPVIPIINFIPNVYAIRVAAPFAALWGAALLFCPYGSSARKKCIGIVIILFALLAALISAGRAVPIISLLSIGCVAFIFRRFVAIFMALASLALFVVVVNILPNGTYDKLPVAVQRATAIIRFDYNEVTAGIDNSTKMRTFLFDEGVKEWKSNSRILWSGRGVRMVTQGDVLQAAQRGSEEARWMVAVRTGRLHRTIGDVMIRYGLLGLLIYYGFQIAAVVYAYKALRFFKSIHGPESALCAVFLCWQIMNLLLGLIANSAFGVFDSWVASIVFGMAIHSWRSRAK